MPHNTSHPRRRVRLALGPTVAGAVAVGALALAGCGGQSNSGDGGSAPSTSSSEVAAGSSSTATSAATTASSNASGLPDTCTLLTSDEVNSVLKGADAGTRQLSQCVWTDPEGTAARLVISQPKAGTSLDTSGGKTLSGVGDAAVVSTAPGSVKIAARAKGYEIVLSVDTGTQDIKPNQDNAVALVNKVIGRLP